MTSIYTASTVVDVVDALPTLFGFELAESFVAIVTNGPRHRFGFRLRLDMPDAAGVDEAARTITQHLNDQRQNGVVLVALSTDEAAADALMAAVVTRLSEAPIVLAVRADDANVWQYDRHGRPDLGAPVYERAQAVCVAVTQAVAEGQQIWASREALAAVFNPAPVLDGIDVAAVEIEAAGTIAVEDLAMAATAALEAIGPATMSDDDARVLAIAAQIIAVRDAIWSTITHETAENDAEVWRHVAIKTAGSAAAGPYALAAFGYWLAGDGARSMMAVEQGARADARHSMIDLVGTVVGAGIDPKTWKGFTG
jgi:hypothetical protein